MERSDLAKKISAFRQVSEIRKFEIELYWKRAAYFWVFIGLAFSAYGMIYLKIIEDGSALPVLNETLTCIACIGIVVSFAWVLVNKGSKFWQENWEAHLDMLEDDITGVLYKKVYASIEECSLKKFVVGAGQFSVSKINQLVSVYVTVLWIILWINTLSIVNECKIFPLDVIFDIVSFLFVLLLFSWGKTGSKKKKIYYELRETVEFDVKGIEPKN